MTSRVAHVAAGSVVGLTWAAALRSWMVELAGNGSTFSWWTVTLVLAPGAAVGAVAGRAVWCRRAGRPVGRWSSWSVVLLAAAVLDPTIMRALVTTGEGSGSLLVTGAGLAGGVVMSRHGWGAVRWTALVVWAAGIAMVTAIGSLAGSPATARVQLVCATGCALVALLGLGTALTRRPGLLVGPTGARVVTTGVAATWLASAVLFLTHGWTPAQLLGGPAPLTLWATALVGGLGCSGLVCLRWRQALLT